MIRYRSTGGGADLVRVEVLVPERDRAEVLSYAAILRARHRTSVGHKALFRALYDEALKKYGARCLWNARPALDRDGLSVVAGRLRKYGDMAAWRLANRIDAAIADAAG
jgi:hypothetical protein